MYISFCTCDAKSQVTARPFSRAFIHLSDKREIIWTRAPAPTQRQRAPSPSRPSFTKLLSGGFSRARKTRTRSEWWGSKAKARLFDCSYLQFLYSTRREQIFIKTSPSERWSIIYPLRAKLFAQLPNRQSFCFLFVFAFLLFATAAENSTVRVLMRNLIFFSPVDIR